MISFDKNESNIHEIEGYESVNEITKGKIVKDQLIVEPEVDEKKRKIHKFSSNKIKLWQEYLLMRGLHCQSFIMSREKL